MDLGFLAALAKGWADQAEFWQLLIYNEQQQPIAAACLCVHKLDCADMGHKSIRNFAQVVRRVWPSFLRLRVLMCGVPFSAAQSSLRMVDDADAHAVLNTLQATMKDLAWQKKARLLLVKECDPQEATTLDALLSMNFLKFDSLSMNQMPACFDDLEDWLGCLRSHYRYKVRKSLRKLEKAGYRCEHLQGAAIHEAYTPELHQLYLDVVNEHDVNFEQLPYEFFGHFAEALSDRLTLTVLRNDERIVAFAWSVLTENRYQNIFVGFDYELNRQLDAYFNLMMRDMGHGMAQGVDEIYLGQTSDIFKSRLGAVQASRRFYIRGIRPVRWVLRAGARWLFPKQTATPPVRDLFKDAVDEISSLA